MSQDLKRPGIPPEAARPRPAPPGSAPHPDSFFQAFAAACPDRYTFFECFQFRLQSAAEVVWQLPAADLCGARPVPSAHPADHRGSAAAALFSSSQSVSPSVRCSSRWICCSFHCRSFLRSSRCCSFLRRCRAVFAEQSRQFFALLVQLRRDRVHVDALRGQTDLRNAGNADADRLCQGQSAPPCTPSKSAYRGDDLDLRIASCRISAVRFMPWIWDSRPAMSLSNSAAVFTSSVSTVPFFSSCACRSFSLLLQPGYRFVQRLLLCLFQLRFQLLHSRSCAAASGQRFCASSCSFSSCSAFFQ